MASQTLTHEKIVKAVQEWPHDRRLKLVQDILKDMASEPAQTSKKTLDQALGLIAKHSDQPAPTDEEVERWLEEARMKKYGLM